MDLASGQFRSDWLSTGTRSKVEVHENGDEDREDAKSELIYLALLQFLLLEMHSLECATRHQKPCYPIRMPIFPSSFITPPGFAGPSLLCSHCSQ